MCVCLTILYIYAYNLACGRCWRYRCCCCYWFVCVVWFRSMMLNKLNEQQTRVCVFVCGCVRREPRRTFSCVCVRACCLIGSRSACNNTPPTPPPKTHARRTKREMRHTTTITTTTNFAVLCLVVRMFRQQFDFKL